MPQLEVHPDEVGELDEESSSGCTSSVRGRRRWQSGRSDWIITGIREPHDVQKHWFIRQLQMAKDTGLPVNIHSRDAAQETFDIIKEHHAGTTGGIIHCFSSSAQMASEYVKLGYYIGIGGCGDV